MRQCCAPSARKSDRRKACQCVCAREVPRVIAWGGRPAPAGEYPEMIACVSAGVSSEPPVASVADVSAVAARAPRRLTTRTGSSISCGCAARTTCRREVRITGVHRRDWKGRRAVAARCVRESEQLDSILTYTPIVTRHAASAVAEAHAHRQLRVLRHILQQAGDEATPASLSATPPQATSRQHATQHASEQQPTQ